MNHDTMTTDRAREATPGDSRPGAMAPSENPPVYPSVEKPAGSTEKALDTKLLGQAIIELNIARKNFSIYPVGHAQLERSIERAHGVLSRLLETSPEITVGVARDCLFVGDSYLDRKNLVFKDFSMALHARDIAAVSFLPGLSREHIHHFCAILTRDTFEIRESGGIQEVAKEASLSHIRVQPIDFSGLHLTEEQEIPAARGKGKIDLNSHVWRSFVANLLSGQLDAQGQLEHLAKNKKLRPSEIAHLLNGGLLNLKKAIESYEATIAKYVRDTTGNQPLESFISLLKDLNPHLRGQFLSVTFDHMAEHGDETVLNCFPDDVVVEMIQQANEEGKEISPTLIALLERISQLRIARPEERRQKPQTASGADSSGRLSRENVKDLLQRESYETYVDSDYQALLKDLITRTAAADGGDESGPSSGAPAGGAARGAARSEGSAHPRNRYQSSIDEHELDLRLTQMMLALMDKAIDSDDYLVFSRKIMESVPNHLRLGEVELAHEILEVFRRHTGEKPQPLSQLAESSLQAFKDPDIISAAVAALDSCTDEQRKKVLSLLAEIGSPCIPELIRAYAGHEYPSPKHALLELLTGFGERTIEEVYNQFDNAPANVLRNLLAVVQAIGKTDGTAAIRRLLSHENRLVSMDALVTLLELKDPYAATFLRQVILSPDPEESFRAIGLAGYYRVAEVSEDLARRIKTRFISQASLRLNEEILRTLGRIGDVRVVPLLEGTAARSWTLSPRRLGIVKLMLFESLAGYPTESLHRLIEIGGKSGDIRIQRICDRLELKGMPRPPA